MEKNIHLPPEGRGTEHRPQALTDEVASVAQNSEQMSRGTERRAQSSEQMSRDNFVRKLIRLGLLVVLAVISVVLSGRITFDKCSGCPGKGRCNGETDCNKY